MIFICWLSSTNPSSFTPFCLHSIIHIFFFSAVILVIHSSTFVHLRTLSSISGKEFWVYRMSVILCLHFCSLLVRWKPWLTVFSLHSTWRGGRCLLICIPLYTTRFSPLAVFTMVGFEQHEYDVPQHNFFIFLMLVFRWLLGSLGLFSSVQFSHSVVSDSLGPHESQHTRPPCPSPTPGVHSDSHPSSQWCHPVISSSVIPFSSCPQSLPASKSFPMSQLSAWGGQSTGVLAF